MMSNLFAQQTAEGLVLTALSPKLTAEEREAAIPEGAVEVSSAPNTRKYRAAWKLEGNKVVVDVEKAKEVFEFLIREERNVRLEKLDREQNIKFSRGEDLTELFAEKQALRDLPKTLDLSRAKTLTQLEALWPKLLS